MIAAVDRQNSEEIEDSSSGEECSQTLIPAVDRQNSEEISENYLVGKVGMRLGATLGPLPYEEIIKEHGLQKLQEIGSVNEAEFRVKTQNHGRVGATKRVVPNAEPQPGTWKEENPMSSQSDVGLTTNMENRGSSFEESKKLR